MEQIFGVSHAHLTVFALRVSQVVHPIFAIDFFWNDRAGLRPFHVPFTLVTGNDNALPLPMNQVCGCTQAELSIFLVRSHSINVVVARLVQILLTSTFSQSPAFTSTT